MMRKLVKTFLTVSTISLLAVRAQAQTSASLDQNADQGSGQYTPMNMDYAGFSSLGMIQSAWLDPLQNLGEGQSKPAYSRYYWTPDLVLPIRLREGMMTLVNFPEWEMVEDIFIGDSASFSGQISGPNTLLLYPANGARVGVDTNIIVFGRSGNKYVFYAKSEGVNTERLTNSIIDIDVIDNKGAAKSSGSGFTGGNGGHLNASAMGSGTPNSVDSRFMRRYLKEDWIKSIPMDVSKFKFDIEVYVPNPDDVLIAPERVWRDDIFTYIDLGEKALTMTQRPIVTLIVERMETPVSFRTKGPNNRLIIVEGVGDMVMRNGKRIVCLKLRRADDEGLEFTPKYENENEWSVAPKIPDNGGSNTGSGYGAGMSSANDSNYYGNGAAVSGAGNYAGNSNNGGISYNGFDGMRQNDGFDYSKMQHISSSDQNVAGVQNPYSGYKYGSGFSDVGAGNISIELGTDSNVTNLESLWSDLSDRYASTLKGYQPFYSVDAPADGQGKELFHLRVGPVKNIETGDKVCSQLGRNGVFCSVVRVQ